MKRLFTAVWMILFAATAGAWAQLAGPPSLGLDFGLFARLSGDVTAYSAKAEVQVFDKNQKVKNTTPFDLALLGKKVRVEIDTTKMQNKELPGAAESLKQMGMDRLVSVIRPDKKAIYIIVPGQQSLVNMPMPQEDVDNFEKPPKLEETALGKETIDGHACVKHKAVFTDDKGGKRESTVWRASDLKNFPVQVLTQEKGETVIVHLRQVQFTKTDAKKFDVPAGFKEYSDVEAMVSGIAMKMLGGAGPVDR